MSANTLLDHIKKTAGIKREWQLAHFLGVGAAQVSNIRKGRLKMGATMILNIHEATDIPIKEIKSWLTAPEEV